MAKMLTRAEVPVEATWNLDDLFDSQQGFEAALKEALDKAAHLTRFKGRLHEGPSVLLDCLKEQDALQQLVMRAASYARLHQSEDGTNPANLANSSKSGDAVSQIRSSLTFIDSELLELEDGKIEAYLSAEPGLAVYERSLKLLVESKPYRLSPETESVLASLSEVLESPYRIYLRGKLSDMTFDDIGEGEDKLPNSFRLYENKYEMSPDTRLRREAYASFSKSLHGSRHTFAEAYATEVKKQVTLSRLRGYSSVTEMLLQPQQVMLDMYNNIHDTLLTELAPHMRRLAALKKKELGLDKMLFCDLKAPLDPDYNPSVTYEEACSIIQEALAVLGPEYGEIVKSAFTERWVDYADNVGKSTGAFCSSIYGVHSYILITWADNMRGAFTLAHEVGHAGHLMLAARNQALVNYRPSMYFIEAPSTMNELLLADHLMAKSQDKRMRRWIISQLLNTYYHNYVTHLLEAELQRRVYRHAEAGEPITADVLSRFKEDILAEFWGDELELDEGAKLTWMRQPHYYMGLYPYTYAAGLTASTAAAQLVREEGQPAVDRWLEVLKAGGSRTPLELMAMAGVDMTSKEPISKAAAYVGSLVAELEALYETPVAQ
ncbi:oligoendopeptidase F [Paenibacillus physcomitrellae]|uniref:Oligopeptidase F n=1 Tax=Paenibacillus physcomitrellae TaxID=1619311 RepID=A0ABQ1FU09_9BACL|nr:oligoendopeptidase F [Paenibacillus physcomitrellae]GGA30733.1 oligoendopeptidase F [Paenibacillus physcomitrellae]